MTGPNVVWALTALGLVLLLVMGAGKSARGFRWGPALPRPGGRGVLAVEARLALDATRGLLLVRCGERQVLLLTRPADQVAGWLDGAGLCAGHDEAAAGGREPGTGQPPCPRMKTWWSGCVGWR